jgi:L-alanine-DL-glutamate epimerase-like enolase superfamily enzyme
MKIIKVEGLLMSCPFEQPIQLPFYGGLRTILKRDAMLIRVTTDSGLKGFAPGPAHERAVREINETIGPFLEGRDPADWRDYNFEAELDLKKTYHAVEVAVIDAAAKAEGATMSELLGGRKRDRIKCYGSAGMYMPPEGYAEEAAAVQGLGFPAYKLRPAAGPETDLKTVELMRQATGPDFGLMLDCHAWWRMGDRSYSSATIEQLCRDLGPYNPYWVEEPLDPDDHAAYKAMHDKKVTTLASGEHEPSEESFLDLIQSGGVDFVQMDVCCQGGFEMGRRVFEATEKQGIRFAFHSWGTLLEVIAAAQLGVCWGENVVEWLEYPLHSNDGKPGMYPFPVADEILTEPLQLEDGYLVMPDGPGLGVEIDESIVEKYPFIPGPWSLFRIDSPRETLAVSGDHSVPWVEVDGGAERRA